MRGLAAIGAILGTAAGLDAQKPAQLHLVRIEMEAMKGLRLKEKFVEGLFVERVRLTARPVVPYFEIVRHRKTGLIQVGDTARCRPPRRVAQ